MPRSRRSARIAVTRSWARAIWVAIIAGILTIGILAGGSQRAPAPAPGFHHAVPVTSVTITPSAFAVTNFTGSIGTADQVDAVHLAGTGSLPDLAVRQNSYGNLLFYRNTSSSGAVSFASAVTVNLFSSGDGLRCVAYADIDGDGKTDFVASTYNGTNLYLGINTSSGAAISFAVTSIAAPAITSGKACGQIALGDLYGNGKMDIAEVVKGSYDPAATTVFIKNTTTVAGSPTFDVAGAQHFTYSYPEQGGSGDPLSIAIAPLAGTGNGNYAAMSEDGSSQGGVAFMHFYHSVSGTMTDALDLHPGSVILENGFSVGDVFGNTSAPKYDIVMPWYYQGLPHVLRNTSSGGVLSFAAAITIPGIGSQTATGSAKLGNFGGTSGAMDLAFPTDGGFQVWLNDGAGNFTAATGSPFATDGQSRSIALADLDGDGYVDWAGSVSVSFNLHVDWAHAQGAPVFSPTSAEAGNQAIGTPTNPIVETITNAGLAPLTGMSFGSPSSVDWRFQYGFRADTCQGHTSLAAVHSPAATPPTACTFNVAFQPATVPGASENATLGVSVTSLSGTANLQLNGNGVSPVRSASPLTFPNTIASPVAQTSSVQTETFTVPTLTPPMGGGFFFSNASSYSISGANAGDFTVTADGCRNQSLYVGGPTSCALQLTFTPGGAGSRNAVLMLTASQGLVQIVPLSGIGIGPATQFSVSTASPATAGSAQDFTVTALDANYNVALGYTGTARFATNDAHPASLPSDYTFTGADAGVHTFSGGVTPFTATATASLTATDTVTSSITGSQTGITVMAGPVTTLTTGYVSPSQAGIANDFTITAHDAYGNVATGYRGTVNVTSSDPQAGLPPSHTFGSADNGSAALPVALKTAGTQSITAADTAGITGTTSGITVTPAAASTLTLTIPTTTIEGVPFSGTVTAKDAYGNVATGYAGTVAFSGPTGATLPTQHAFTTDNGVHTFASGFAAAEEGGSLSFAATDTVTASITGTASTSTVDAALTVTPTDFSGTEGVTLTNATVATFTDADPAGVAGDYSATIDWGDGTSSSAGTVSLGTGNFAVKGSHTYAEESPAGGYKVRVTVQDAGGALGLNWTQRTPATSPPARQSASMVYDAATQTEVLFGGANTVFLNDTWTWDGTNWTQKFPANSPPSRVGATMAYDAGRHLVVLFGGSNGSAFLGDTWTWDGTNWTPRSPANSPPARASATMAYDAATSSVVLFGGGVGASQANDTWIWDGTTWTQQTPATSPPARSRAGMAYDQSNATIVLFGGSGFLGDTWTWDGTTWTQQALGSGPPGRYLVSLAYDVASRTVILFGGQNGSGTSGYFNDTWSWNGTTWSLQAPAGGVPSARGSASLDYFAPSDGMILFGGIIASALGDTWTLDPATATASIADAALTPTRQDFRVLEGAPYNPTVATFVDADPNGTATDYTASINWGDGVTNDTGSVTFNVATSNFVVAGTHNYADEGSYTVTTTITDSGGATTTVTSTATVADGFLTPVSANTFTAREGTPTGANSNLATFTDANPTAVAGDYTVVITWGDGGTSAGSVSGPVGGVFTVSAPTHTYAEECYCTVTVQVTDTDGGANLGTPIQFTEAVSDAILTGSGSTITATEGASYTGTVASFTDADPGSAVSDFTATINWGDGATGISGTVLSNGAGGYLVSATHTYAEQGTYTVTTAIADSGGASRSTTGTANVGDAALSGSGTTVTGTEGSLLSNVVVATFTDADPSGTATDYAASITWGDGHTSSGTVTAITGGFQVAGSNTYADECSCTITVTITDNGSLSPAGPHATATVTSTASIADAALSSSASGTQSAAEGASYTGVVATFTDSAASEPTGDYTATINWGDATSASTGTISFGAGVFSVTGTHTYAEQGSYTASISITDNVASTSASTSFSVADAALSGSPQTVSGTEGAALAGAVVAVFTDADPGGTATDYTASITWGDGQTSTGSVSTHTGGGFQVTATHTYAEECTCSVSVLITDNGSVQIGGPHATVTVNSTANIADAALSTSGQAVSATEAAAYSGTTATFTDADAAGVAGDYTASVDWGDGTTSAGSVSLGSGNFVVTAGHTYSEDGSFTVKTTINDTGGASTVATSTATVTDAALSASGQAVSATEGASYSGTTATFTDTDPNGTVTDFTATINWGDGTSVSGGAVTLGTGTFVVTGTHTYAEDGTYTVTTKVTDAGGATTTATSTATIADAALTNVTAVAVTGAEGAALGTTTTLTGSSGSSNMGCIPCDGQARFLGIGQTAISAGCIGCLATTIPGGGVLHNFSVTQSSNDGGTWYYGVYVNGAGVIGCTVSGSATTCQNSATSVTVSSTDLVVVGIGNPGAPFTFGTFTTAFSLQLDSPRVTVATFTDPAGAEPLTDYAATIDWGDGTSSWAGTVTYDSTSHIFSVGGTHTYAEAGTPAMTVTITHDALGSVTLHPSVTVADAPLSSSGVTPSILANPNSTLSAIFASFTDADPAGTLTDYTASINWGDGTSAPGTGTIGTGSGAFAGRFTVTGSHQFLGSGNKTVTVTIHDGTGAQSVATTTVVVDPPLTATPALLNLTEGASATPQVAHFTDGDPNGVLAQYHATIQWGDGGSSTSTGVINSDGAGGWNVTGTHTYAEETSYSGAVAAAHPNAFWRLNDSGATAFDSSGNGQSGSIIGTVTKGVAGATLDGDTAMSFAGTGYIEVPYATANNTAVFSVEAWARVTGGLGTDRAVVASRDCGALNGWTIYAGSDNQWNLLIGDGPSWHGIPGGAVQLNQWTHLVATYDGVNASLYVDGVLAGQSALVYARNNCRPLRIGAGATEGAANFMFVGSVDEVSLYPTALSAATVTAHRNAGLYQTQAPYIVTATITDSGGAQTTVYSTAIVADGALAGTGTTTTVGAGAPQLVKLGSFTDTDPAANADDYGAWVNWGDGTSSAATVSGGGSPFAVSTSHQYTSTGTYTATVSVIDGGGAATTYTTTVNVPDMALLAAGAPISASEGVAFTGAIATFTDVDPAGVATQFTASVDWGDGRTGGASVSPAGGGFTVTGTHTWADEGPYPVTVQIFDSAGFSVSTISTATVADGALTVTSRTYQAVAGVTGTSQVIATFVDTNPSAVASEFSATITWGDAGENSSSIGVVSAASGGFQVTGNHTYRREGVYRVGVTILDVGGATVATAFGVGVADGALTGTVVGGLTVARGVAFTNVTLANFTDSDTSATPDDYSVFIAWGDGTTSQGDTSSGSIRGSHTYLRAGNFLFTITLIDVGGSRWRGSGSYRVPAPRLAVTMASTSFTLTRGVVGASGTIATFTDPDGNVASTAPYAATIDWGDGATSVGTIGPFIQGAFQVRSGGHSYAQPGAYYIHVYVHDTDGSGGAGQALANVSDVVLT